MKLTTYPTLFSRTSSGDIQIWYMQQNGSAYRMCSGREDGKIVESAWTTVKGKNNGRANETTAEQQCQKDINARYKKQLKSGYFAEKSEIDNVTFFEPMLAKNFKNERKNINWSEGVAVQNKYNGGRLIATAKGLFTRTGEPYVSIPHIQATLAPFFAMWPNAVLDGEVFNNDLREQLNEQMSIIRKTVNVTEADLQISEKLIRYYVYDGFGCGACSEDGYIKRKEALDKALKGIKYIEHVPTQIVYNEADFLKIYNSFLADKQEGAIIRLLNKPYINGRSKYLIKYKPMDDAEFELLDVTEGSGNWAGRARIISLRMDNGKTFDADFKGKMEQAEKFLKEKDKWIGKKVTIYYFGFTGLGTPNYAKLDYNNFIPSTK